MVREIVSVVVCFILLLAITLGLLKLLPVVSTELWSLTNSQSTSDLEAFKNGWFIKVGASCVMVAVGLVIGWVCVVMGRTGACAFALAALTLVFWQVSIYFSIQHLRWLSASDSTWWIAPPIKIDHVPLAVMFFTPFGQAIGIVVGGLVLGVGKGPRISSQVSGI